MDPVGSLIGAVLIGFGVLVVYGAYRNKKVFGADGIVTQALTTGSVTNLSDVSTALEGFGSGAVTPTGIEGFGSGAAGGVPLSGFGLGVSPLSRALTTIKTGDPSLGADIENRVHAISASSTHAQLMPLAQLLALADAKGFRDSVAVIRLHVLEVAGESI